MLLCDRDIRARVDRGLLTVAGSPLPSSDLELGKDSLVQPSSLDMRIGKIFLPERGQNDEGGTNKGLGYHLLPPGATAIVETKEEIAMPPDLAAFGFPPTEVSTAGVLMTNPGHVDPGYQGTLKFTLINMSRQPFGLAEGGKIVTLLLIPLNPPDKTWSDLSKERQSVVRGVKPEQVARLFADFLDVERRAERIAEKHALGVRKWAVVGTIIAALVAALGSMFAFYSGVSERVARLEGAQTSEVRRIVDSAVARAVDSAITTLNAGSTGAPPNPGGN
jgi:dCTP deaminase